MSELCMFFYRMLLQWVSASGSGSGGGGASEHENIDQGQLPCSPLPSTS